jgi:hypothetical protein
MEHVTSVKVLLSRMWWPYKHNKPLHAGIWNFDTNIDHKHTNSVSNNSCIYFYIYEYSNVNS